MIIRQLKLQPFAGIRDLQVDFREGLNVLLGPNEAGKSTLVNALKMALFMPTQYGKRAFQREIKRFLPVSGGDTIQVELTFASGGRVYRLTKSWGKGRQCRLLLPEGGLLTDAQAVQDRLQELMVFKEGTFNSVLFAHQSGLGSTLDSFSEDPTPTHDLASVLRQAVFETDGVSIERLGQIIQERYEAYFSRWDPELKRPQDSRGIDRPFKKGVGKILAAYYEKERLSRVLAEALEYERQVDELGRRLQNISGEITSLREFVDRNRQAVEDVRKGMLLKARKKALQEEEQRLREVSHKWPALEQEIRDKEERLQKLRGKYQTLAEELRRAEEYEANKRRLQKFERAAKKKKKWEEALQQLNRMKVIEEEDYRSLERLHEEINRLKTGLEAGKITFSLLPEKPMKLRVVKDLEEETSCDLQPGQALELAAGGRLHIRHADWTMKVKSGEMEFDQLTGYYDKLSRDYQALSHRLQVADFSAARDAYEACRQQGVQVERLKAEFEEVLEGESYDALEELARTFPHEGTPRQTTAVTRDQVEVEVESRQIESDLKSKTAQLTAWRQEYESQDKLLDQLVAKRTDLKELDGILRDLKPLPESVEDPELFVKDFDEKQEILKKRQAELYELRIRRAELEGQAPEETREEIEARWRDAERRFEQVEREASAIAEISDTFWQIKSAMDAQTLDPWLDELGRVAASLTMDRYKLVTLQEGDPGKAVRADGLEMPCNLLSMGTKVGLGLALRLAAARYFLEGLAGFLILDDPLVDLDSRRQQAAATVLRDFAAEKQVVLFTCHSSHARLLGGHCIELEIPD